MNLEDRRKSRRWVTLQFSMTVSMLTCVHVCSYTHHTGKELSVVITGHASWTVELEPAIFPWTHAEQAGVDLESTHTGWLSFLRLKAEINLNTHTHTPPAEGPLQTSEWHISAPCLETEISRHKGQFVWKLEFTSFIRSTSRLLTLWIWHVQEPCREDRDMWGVTALNTGTHFYMQRDSELIFMAHPCLSGSWHHVCAFSNGDVKLLTQRHGVTLCWWIRSTCRGSAELIRTFPALVRMTSMNCLLSAIPKWRAETPWWAGRWIQGFWDNCAFLLQCTTAQKVMNELLDSVCTSQSFPL